MMTSMREILGRDYGIEEPYGDPQLLGTFRFEDENEIWLTVFFSVFSRILKTYAPWKASL